MIGRATIPDVPNDQQWNLDFRFWSGNSKGTPATISTASAKMRKRTWDDTTPDFVMNTGNSRLSLSDNIVSIVLTPDEMGNFEPGTYDFEVQATDANGGVRQLRLVFNIVAGV